MRDPMNDNNKTANNSDTPSMNNDSAPLNKQSRTEVYRPNKPEIVYNTLLDDSPLGITRPQPVKVTDNVSISAEPIDQAIIDHTQQDTIKENTIADDDVSQSRQRVNAAINILKRGEFELTQIQKKQLSKGIDLT